MYINFFPGTTREARSLSTSGEAAYGAQDITGLVDSMIVGCTGSVHLDGVKDALEDGSIWGNLCEKHGEEAVQAVLEELHDLVTQKA